MELLNPLNQWLPIQGYEGIYEIFYDGIHCKIKSLDRIIEFGGKKYYYKSRMLKIFFSKSNGYYKITLSGNPGCSFQFYVHRIIAIIYIPNIQNKKFINHKNGIKTDLSIDNLEWCTQKENMLHAYSIGLVRYDPLNRKNKLKKEQIIEIIKLRQAGTTYNKIASIFNIKVGSISAIMFGKTYKEESKGYL